ncbi:unnamed protein product [Camellia sinensis]
MEVQKKKRKYNQQRVCRDKFCQQQRYIKTGRRLGGGLQMMKMTMARTIRTRTPLRSKKPSSSDSEQQSFPMAKLTTSSSFFVLLVSLQVLGDDRMNDMVYKERVRETSKTLLQI